MFPSLVFVVGKRTRNGSSFVGDSAGYSLVPCLESERESVWKRQATDVRFRLIVSWMCRLKYFLCCLLYYTCIYTPANVCLLLDFTRVARHPSLFFLVPERHGAGMRQVGLPEEEQHRRSRHVGQAPPREGEAKTKGAAFVPFARRLTHGCCARVEKGKMTQVCVCVHTHTYKHTHTVCIRDALLSLRCSLHDYRTRCSASENI